MTHMDFLDIALDIMDGNRHDLSELWLEIFKNRHSSRTHGLMFHVKHRLHKTMSACRVHKCYKRLIFT